MTTQDIRISRLEGRVDTLESVQGKMLDKLDVVLANQMELKANQDELRANLDELKAELQAVQANLVRLIAALAQDVADIKDRVIGRPMGFIKPDDGE